MRVGGIIGLLNDDDLEFGVWIFGMGRDLLNKCVSFLCHQLSYCTHTHCLPQPCFTVV